MPHMWIDMVFLSFWKSVGAMVAYSMGVSHFGELVPRRLAHVAMSHSYLTIILTRQIIS